METMKTILPPLLTHATLIQMYKEIFKLIVMITGQKTALKNALDI